MLTVALAQYRAHPSDYLAGTVIGMMRMLALPADRSWCDLDARERNEAERAMRLRVREFLNGTKAAMAWAQGTSGPPLPMMVTEHPEPDDREGRQ